MPRVRVRRSAAKPYDAAMKELVSLDPFITTHLKPSEITACFDPMYYLRHLDQVFRRVFGARAVAATRRRRRRA